MAQSRDSLVGVYQNMLNRYLVDTSGKLTSLFHQKGRTLAITARAEVNQSGGDDHMILYSSIIKILSSESKNLKPRLVTLLLDRPEFKMHYQEALMMILAASFKIDPHAASLFCVRAQKSLIEDPQQGKDSGYFRNLCSIDTARILVEKAHVLMIRPYASPNPPR